MKFGRKESLFAGTMADENNGGMNQEDSVRTLPPPKTPVRPSRSSGVQGGQLNAFLGRGCIYEGKLTFEGRVRIDGKFTGEIFSNDTLEIGPDAELEAEIDVATVIIAGCVHGDIKARMRCDLRAPGVVVGNITSPIITMDEGVQFDGQMRMQHALEEAVRATTQRAPSALPLVFAGVEAVEPPTGPIGLETLTDDSERVEAPAAPDPSDLLNPVS